MTQAPSPEQLAEMVAEADATVDRLSSQLGNAVANATLLSVRLERVAADRARLAEENQRLVTELEAARSAQEAG